jgi:hypothetical protein
MSAEMIVQRSLEEWKRRETDARQKFYDRLADHYYSTFEGKTYFPKYYAESDKRYKERPKRSLQVSASAIDVLTGSMLGSGFDVKISDDSSDDTYQEIAKNNNLGGQFGLLQATIASTFGFLAVRIAPTEFPVTKLEAIEFEAVDPRYFRPVYNANSINRSKKKARGISFATLYDPSDGRIVPFDAPEAGGNFQNRLEVIDEDRWLVYLDDELAPTDPVTGERWMPSDDGSNPFKVVPASYLWNIHQLGAFEGRSDIDPGYQTAEDINRSYSQVLNNIDNYFPTLILPKGENATASPISRGIGLGIESDGDLFQPNYIIPPLNVDALIDPLKLQLNVFFSSVHTPASSHGLGAVFGEAKSAESGKAKFYEFNRLERHVTQKRANFEAYKREEYKILSTFLENSATGKKLDPEATVEVIWESPIVPISTEEARDLIVGDLKDGLISHLEAIMRHRGIDAEAAQAIIDEIAVQATRVKPKADDALEFAGLLDEEE